jgi:hypothetical protein
VRESTNMEALDNEDTFDDYYNSEQKKVPF